MYPELSFPTIFIRDKETRKINAFSSFVFTIIFMCSLITLIPQLMPIWMAYSSRSWI